LSRQHNSNAFLTDVQSTDFREKALAAQSLVQQFEGQIKSSKRKLSELGIFQGALTFDQEFAFDSLVSFRSLVISSLFAVEGGGGGAGGGGGGAGGGGGGGAGGAGGGA
jgi:hypothetical protein